MRISDWSSDGCSSRSLGGVPSALHGISIDPSFPEWAAPLLSGFAEVVDYATVRDPASQARLTSWAPHRTVSIIPDSIFSISRVIARGTLSTAAHAFLAGHDRHSVVADKRVAEVLVIGGHRVI